ncbi:hypothetical protein DFJ73DRAFT_404483 [Zopfochytrium polystomum]|nr:hypothetical protein DFJ73DRAFT_404483 [Zopfochytrium polystomum]
MANNLFSQQYKDFFPTATPDTTTKIPVWGVATVIASTHKAVHVGERIYGYFPAAAYYDLIPNKVTDLFFDVRRPQLPGDRVVYNQYFRCKHDPMYSAATEDITIIFRPLWATSYYLFDMGATNGFFGADAVVVISASSKTGFCFAQLVAEAVKATSRPLKIVGMTSSRSKVFVAGLGVFTDTVDYGANVDAGAANVVAAVPTGRVAIFDFAGSVPIRSAIVKALGSRVAKGVVIGLSHSETAVASSQSPKEGKDREAPKANVDEHFEMFFAPMWAQERIRKIGGAENQRRMVEGWQVLLRDVRKWIKFRDSVGVEAALRVYEKVLKGTVPADEAHILTLLSEGNSRSSL